MHFLLPLRRCECFCASVLNCLLRVQCTLFAIHMLRLLMLPLQRLFVFSDHSHTFYIFKSYFLLSQYHICCLTSAASVGFLTHTPTVLQLYWTTQLRFVLFLFFFCYWHPPAPMPMSSSNISYVRRCPFVHTFIQLCAEVLTQLPSMLAVVSFFLFLFNFILCA